MRLSERIEKSGLCEEMLQICNRLLREGGREPV